MEKEKKDKKNKNKKKKEDKRRRIRGKISSCECNKVVTDILAKLSFSVVMKI